MSPSGQENANRISSVELQVARNEEKIKTSFNQIEGVKELLEKHEERGIAYHRQVEADIEDLSKKMDKLIKKQNNLIAMKNKWTGIILALTFLGSIGFTFLDAISSLISAK